MNQPIAFMSYVRLDDDYDQGRLTEFRKRLSAEVGIQTGEDFPIFQDRIDIKWGDDWKRRIEDALASVLLLIPVITPGFFKSEACRYELEYFLERERGLNRNDLILPIYYVDCPLLNDKTRRERDKLAQVIASRQYADWRELRFEPFSSQQVGKTLSQLAIQIRDVRERSYPSTRTTTDSESHEDQRPEGTAQSLAPGSLDVPYTEDRQDTARSPYPKNEPPRRIVDPKSSNDYATIAEAVRAANPGDRIVVRPGIYEEGITIDKTLEILGEGALNEIVVQATGENALSFRTTFGRVVNLTLRQMGGGEDLFGVHIMQGRLELEGCDISSQSSSCVAIQGGADPRIRFNRIHDGKASGVYVFDNGRGTLEDNEIFRNALAGVSIKNGGDPTVRRNRIHDCVHEGIIIYDSGQGTIEDNSIFGNGYSGVEIRDESAALLRRNRIYNGNSGGVYVHKNSQSTLEENHIFGNRLAGVAIKTGANPTVRRNFIYNGGQSGIFVNDNGQGMIEDNDIFGNDYSGIEIKNGSNLTLKHNRINKNAHLAIYVSDGGGGTIDDNDLTDNAKGAFYISEDSGPHVKREGNKEK